MVTSLGWTPILSGMTVTIATGGGRAKRPTGWGKGYGGLPRSFPGHGSWTIHGWPSPCWMSGRTMILAHIGTLTLNRGVIIGGGSPIRSRIGVGIGCRWICCSGVSVSCKINGRGGMTIVTSTTGIRPGVITGIGRVNHKAGAVISVPIGRMTGGRTTRLLCSGVGRGGLTRGSRSSGPYTRGCRPLRTIICTGMISRGVMNVSGRRVWSPSRVGVVCGGPPRRTIYGFGGSGTLASRVIRAPTAKSGSTIRGWMIDCPRRGIWGGISSVLPGVGFACFGKPGVSFLLGKPERVQMASPSACGSRLAGEA